MTERIYKAKGRIPITCSEFIDRILLGERDFNRIEFTDHKLSKEPRYDELVSYCRMQHWREEPLQLQSARLNYLLIKDLDLSYMQARSVDLSHCFLQNVWLDHAVLDHARMEDVRLHDVRFSGAQMPYAFMYDSTLRNVSFSGANTSNVRLDMRNTYDLNTELSFKANHKEEPIRYANNR